MGLQLITGGSGTGKTRFVLEEAIRLSEDEKKNIIILVPEQETMQMQRKVVALHPNHGILNIDVVSFNRLAYKILDETGGGRKPVLDDTGKNLIVRKVLAEHEKELTYFGGNVNRQGFVSELKSLISEFLQYDVSPELLEGIEKNEEDSPVARQLKNKMHDILLIYNAFKEYLSDRFITSEEILDVFCEYVGKSEILKHSVIFLDGFTGFTPIQYKLITLLLAATEKIYATVTIPAGENTRVLKEQNDLFYMSRDMVAHLCRAVDDVHGQLERDIVLEENYRFKNNEELHFLEQHLLRPGRGICRGRGQVQIVEAASYSEELKAVVDEIMRLTREEGYQYKDIAVITGDLASYATAANQIFRQTGIPAFIDFNRSIKDNPFVEYIRAALDVFNQQYSYDSVFRYLKSGMITLSDDEIARLENYCLATGVRGRKKWSTEWTRTCRRAIFKPELAEINSLREYVATPLLKLEEVLRERDATVLEQCKAMYRFVTENHSAKKLRTFEKDEKAGEEYSQLYKMFMNLLNEMAELLGGEKVTLREFTEILEAGLDEISVGVLPATTDYVTVGDITRSRLSDVKVLFFIGVNDGVIPKHNENTSVLSETDRTYLTENKIELAPSSREKSFQQRFYLYQMLTKPQDRLILSYARKDPAGGALSPSYLIRSVSRMFPGLEVKGISERDAKRMYWMIPKSKLKWDEERARDLISMQMAAELFGNSIQGSVSSFEQYAECEFAYFLSHGLGLEEREELTFNAPEFGSALHNVLQVVSENAKKAGISLADMSDEVRKQAVHEATVQITNLEMNSVLHDTERGQFAIQRIEEMAERTVWAIGKQLAVGDFTPESFEEDFQMDFSLKNGNNLHFIGRIDRMDVAEDDENVYVRVVDYKTGKSKFDLAKMFYGLQLQLMFYMKAALEKAEKRHPGKTAVPAGVLYFNVKDPILDLTDESIGDVDVDSQEAIDAKMLNKLRMEGAVNTDERVLNLMDHTEAQSKGSVVINMDRTQKGEFSAYAKVMSPEHFVSLNDYVENLSKDMCEGLYRGEIKINPYSEVKKKDNTACKYCKFNGVCAFSKDLGQRDFREIKGMSDEEIWEHIDAFNKEKGEE